MERVLSGQIIGETRSEFGVVLDLARVHAWANTCMSWTKSEDKLNYIPNIPVPISNTSTYIQKSKDIHIHIYEGLE